MTCTAFEGSHRIASGGVIHVARLTKETIDRGTDKTILVFSDADARLVEIDFRGTVDEICARLQAGDSPRKPGRPKLGVVAREVTLLPRHWEWLNEQPGGASVALRKLVEEARRNNDGRDRVRRAREAAYRFLAAMAGNEPGFEEATRALFAGNRRRFEEHSTPWPTDVRDHGLRLAEPAFMD